MILSCLSDTRLERTIGSGWQRSRQSEGRGCGVRCVTGLSGSIVSPFLFSNADATAGNAPSMARFRLALPSVAGHCWDCPGYLRAPKPPSQCPGCIPCPLADYGVGMLTFAWLAGAFLKAGLLCVCWTFFVYAERN